MVFEHFERGKKRIEHDFLRDDPDRAARIAALAVDIKAPNLGRTGGFVHQPCEDIDQGRLARSIGAKQTKDRTFGHVKAHPFERQLTLRIGAFGPFGRGIAFDDIVDPDCR